MPAMAVLPRIVAASAMLTSALRPGLGKNRTRWPRSGPDTIAPMAGVSGEPVRCAWAGDDPLMQRYHDEEWGIPLHDDRPLFELLVLEGAQAGIS